MICLCHNTEQEHVTDSTVYSFVESLLRSVTHGLPGLDEAAFAYDWQFWWSLNGCEQDVWHLAPPEASSNVHWLQATVPSVNQVFILKGYLSIVAFYYSVQYIVKCHK